MTWELLADGPKALAEFGLTWLCQSSALLALGLLAGRLLRSSGPAVQSVAYRTTLATILICPIASALLARLGFDGVTLRLPVAAVETARVDPSPTSVINLARPVEPIAPGRRPEVASPATASSLPTIVAMPNAVNPRLEAGLTVAPSRPRLARTDGIAAGIAFGLMAWAVGALVMTLRLGVGLGRMARLRRSAVPTGPAETSLCRDLAGRMRLRTPVVLRAPFLDSPCVDGLRSPAILLPDDSGLDLRDTFVHELAHLARRDILWNLLRQGTSALLWFQPMLWVLSRRIEVTAEEVCDDYVMQFGADRARYAGLLLDLAGRTLSPVAPTAVGMVSLRSLLARRVVRILDSSRALSTQAGTRAVLSMMAAGLAGTMLAGLLGVGGPRRPALAQQPSAKNEAMRSASKDEPNTRIEATAPAEARKPAMADMPITGRVVDLEGRPVAGVSVKVDSFQTPRSGDLSSWLAAVRGGEPPEVATRYLNWSDKVPEGVRGGAITDRDGRFRLEGLGADRVVTMTLTGDTIAATAAYAVTRRIEPIAATGFPSHYGPGGMTILGAEFTLSPRPGRPVEGVVIDAATRQPMAGVEVQSSRFSGSDFVQIDTLKATTDARGKFRLVGLPKGPGNRVLAVPNDDQPYFQREVNVDDPPGIGPVAIEIGLHRGIWITGRVTNKATGQPARDARLHYLPFLDNKHVQALPEFDRDGNVQGSQMRYRTRPDGSYKLVGMPGRAVVGADDDGKNSYRAGAGFEAFKKEDLNEYGYLKTWNNPIFAGKSWPLTMKEINPPLGAEQVTLDLQFDPGLSVRLRAVDPEGKPVSGVTLVGSGRGPRPGTTSDAEVTLLGFGPGEKRNIIVRHEGRKLGKVIRVGPGDDEGGPLVVTLAPLARVKGRTVDADGQPMPKTKVRPDVLPGGDFGLQLSQVVADQDGRFEVLDVPTGCDYTMFAEAGTMSKDYRQAWVDAKVKPGETTDVGEIRFQKD